MENKVYTQTEMIKMIRDDMEELDQRTRFNSLDIDAIQDELWDHIDEERKKANIEKAIVYGVVLGWMASMLYLVLMIAAKVA